MDTLADLYKVDWLDFLLWHFYIAFFVENGIRVNNVTAVRAARDYFGKEVPLRVYVESMQEARDFLIRNG